MTSNEATTRNRILRRMFLEWFMRQATPSAMCAATAEQRRASALVGADGRPLGLGLSPPCHGGIVRVKLPKRYSAPKEPGVER
jgi:pheromone shutdown protein TraB